MFKVVTFYHFIPLFALAEHRAIIKTGGQAVGAVGTLLLAPEGVNATLASDNPDFATWIAQLTHTLGVRPENIKWSTAQEKPFKRLKIRLKREVITLKRGELALPDLAGIPVPAAAWNALISQNDVLVMDTRNSYETALGTFRGAVDPGLTQFSDFADYVDRLDPATTPKIAMFCTGGIRCEKASAYMRAKGFQHVYQLQGGILKYLEVVPSDQSLWDGTCFVFDDRGALGTGLVES